jgi:hypothetical protein
LENIKALYGEHVFLSEDKTNICFKVWGSGMNSFIKDKEPFATFMVPKDFETNASVWKLWQNII